MIFFARNCQYFFALFYSKCTTVHVLSIQPTIVDHPSIRRVKVIMSFVTAFKTFEFALMCLENCFKLDRGLVIDASHAENS